MCLTIPGKVVEIGDDRFVIEYPLEKRTVEISLVKDLKVGDYVAVSNKIIYTKIDPENVKKFYELTRA